MKNYLIIQNQKSLSLPSGKIGFRSQQDKVEIVDKELFFNKASPDLLRRVPESFEPNLKMIKELIKKTGFIPNGIEVKSHEAKFYYKINQNNGG
jgi:hypothetical protein